MPIFVMVETQEDEDFSEEAYVFVCTCSECTITAYLQFADSPNSRLSCFPAHLFAMRAAGPEKPLIASLFLCGSSCCALASL